MLRPGASGICPDLSTTEAAFPQWGQYIAPIGDMSPYSLNVAIGARILHSAFWEAKNSYFCNVNGLPRRRSAAADCGSSIPKRPAVYSPTWGKSNIPPLQEGSLLNLAESGVAGAGRMRPLRLLFLLSHNDNTKRQHYMTMKLFPLGRI